MPKRYSNYIVFLLSLILTACSASEGSFQNRTSRVVTDDLGRRIGLPQAPYRLISLAPNVTEMLFALGVGDQVVGVTSYCDYPPEARAIPKIGDTIHPSVERILALSPDLVIASRASQLEQFAHRLDSLKIPLYVIDAHRLVDIPRSLRRLGVLLNRRSRAQVVAQDIEHQIAEIARKLAGAERPKVLLVIQQNPLMVPGARSYLADLIQNAGGRAIGPDDVREGVTFSLESVLAECPDFIILPRGEGANRRMDHSGGPMLTALRAVGCGTVRTVDPDLIYRPGPRLVEGLSALARILHSDRFGN